MDERGSGMIVVVCFPLGCEHYNVMLYYRGLLGLDWLGRSRFGIGFGRYKASGLVSRWMGFSLVRLPDCPTENFVLGPVVVVEC